MPFPNFHACRLIDPGKFSGGWVTVERRSKTVGKKYNVIRGRLKSTGDMTDQAYRYPKSTWSESESRSHCKRHNGILFEKATEEKASARMTLLYNQPWAMEAMALNEILSHYEGIDCRVPGLNLNDDVGVRQVGNTAIIPIVGILSQRLSLHQYIYGGVSTEDVCNQIKAALQNDEISQLILEIDSPGGSINGVQALGNFIFEARDKKKIVAYVSSIAFSAAAWIASATSEVVLSSKTARVGSLGIVIAHREVSGLEAKMGIKTTEITVGKQKHTASTFAPLTKEGRDFLFSQAKAVHDEMVVDLARNLFLEEKHVRAALADAQVFTGQQAIDAGLATRIESLDNLLLEAKSMPENIVPIPDTPVAAPEALTVEKIRAEHGSLYDEIFAAGVSAERARLTAIDKIAGNAPAAAQEIVAKARAEGTKPEILAMAIMTDHQLHKTSQQPETPEAPILTAEELADEAPMSVESPEAQTQAEVDAAEEETLLKVMAEASGATQE